MNNKQAGTEFEKAFAGILAENWFWVHLFQDNRNGQPCDVIAARNGQTHLFDCKDCQGDFFQLNRMEENQYNAMKLFELTGNNKGMFAIRFRDEKIYLLEYDRIKELQTADFKRINSTVCRTQGKSLEEWLEQWNTEDSRGDQNADRDWK